MTKYKKYYTGLCVVNDENQPKPSFKGAGWIADIEAVEYDPTVKKD